MRRCGLDSMVVGFTCSWRGVLDIVSIFYLQIILIANLKHIVVSSTVCYSELCPELV